MADTSILVMLIYFLIVSNIASYSIQNRIPDIFANRRISSHRISNHSSPNVDDCTSVDIANELECSFIPKDFLYYELFEAICKQHQLCYACGTIQGVSERKCNTLSRLHMYEECSKNKLIQSDCLQKRFFALASLQKAIYRLSEFSTECYDNCILKYLYSNPNIK